MINFLGLKMVAYAADPEKVKVFYKMYNECISELGLPKSEYKNIILKNLINIRF